MVAKIQLWLWSFFLLPTHFASMYGGQPTRLYYVPLLLSLHEFSFEIVLISWLPSQNSWTKLGTIHLRCPHFLGGRDQTLSKFAYG